MRATEPMLTQALATIGPPGAGKTTLTMHLARTPGSSVFRLREHVPETLLAATATSAERLGWLDDVTVTRALRGYVEHALHDVTVCTLLLDNFPGSGTQARLLLAILRRHVPECKLHVAELVADPAIAQARVRNRRVCHQCENDPIRDPRLPAEPSASDPRRCARCGGILHPRRGDAPRLLDARTERYAWAAVGIRAAFADAGIEVIPLDASRPPELSTSDLSQLLETRRTAI